MIWNCDLEVSPESKEINKSSSANPPLHSLKWVKWPSFMFPKASVAYYYHIMLFWKHLFPDTTLATFLQVCCSVDKSRPTLRNPMDCSMPGFPVLHYLPEFAQTHIHWIRDVIQRSHPLSPPFLPASIFPSVRVFPNESTLCLRLKSLQNKMNSWKQIQTNVCLPSFPPATS